MTSRSRYAGILLHITSLPGPAYIGDVGPCAKRFAEFLYGSGQSYWQLLPVQPISASQGFSPYSSTSSVAGNPLLISPELLAKEKLIRPVKTSIFESNHTDYPKAKKYKDQLLDKAFKQWQKKKENKSFEEFCNKENYWLNDFALYTALKKTNKGKPWFDWPENYKYRNANKLKQFALVNEYEIQKTKWIQFVFDQQWKELKTYCDSLGIQLIGDVPFYIGHNSADVWAHPEIFDIDQHGRLINVAGAPPDDFNKDGQLWGMPVFNWDKLKERNYDWWVSRLKKNLEYFDILRLDHFRAFAAYWSVSAAEKTAKKGKWVPGPGKEFFDKIKSEVGTLPFIAEDLGDIDEPVYQLRDELKLPGMNVLHFAFGDDMPQSQYLPHHHIYNSLVYTGTHDNDTTLGWFKTLEKTHRKNIEEYIGEEIDRKNICDKLCRLAYMSASKIAILPMQDVLGLGTNSRMNKPASPDNNWTWRLRNNELSARIEKKLNLWSFYYGRMRE